ncbi:eukaryotic translation initiation factor 4G-like [Tasmannia lanceolata]|uniref:eukaryotic translation initiation factor 4G-like n=1 Tax=Tasmannia lanceolata TaxID=3420 RepID=UPI004062FF68
MSLNQSRAERSESQSRKPGRSGISAQQRSFSGGRGKGGGGTAPPLSSSSSNRSNGQGAQSRARLASANSESGVPVANSRTVQNGSHIHSSIQGVSDAPVPGGTKPIDSSAPRGSRVLPKAPSSQSAAGPSDSGAPVTPSKGDASKAFPLQFGTLSPGFMNGMQIPARTSSAPPNLDEQKCDQARHDSIRSVPPLPIPYAPKPQQQPRKDSGVTNQSNTVESHPQTQAKRDVRVQVPAARVPATPQKSSIIPMTAMSMPMPFQQPQVPVQFGGPNPQIQSQGVTASSLQMQMPLSVGNAAQVQQQVFVPGLQSHSLQQGMMHPGFAPQMGHHQLPPQLGNLGIGMAPQFAHQQAGKFAGPCKVKITHPDTHEELRLDKRTESYLGGAHSSGPRSHPNVAPQSQPIPSFSPALPMNYYSTIQPNSYNPPSIYFSASTSLPMTSTQMTPASSTSRYNYTVGQGGSTISFMNPSSLNPLPVSKSGSQMLGISEPVNLEHAHDGRAISAPPPSSSVQVTVKPAFGPPAEKTGTSSVIVSSPAIKGEPHKLSKQSGEASFSPLQRGNEIISDSGVQRPKSVSESSDTTSSDVVSNSEGRRREPISRSESIKDQQQKQGKKELRQSQQQHQVDASASAGTWKLSSLKISEDSGSSGLNTRQAAKNSENLMAPIEAVGVPAMESLPYPSLEHSVSSLVTGSETEEGESVPATSKCSVVGLETSAKAMTDGVQDGEGGPCEPSNPFGLELDVAISEDLDSVHHVKQGDCVPEEVGLKQDTMGTTEIPKTEAPEGLTQDCINFKKHTGSALPDSSEGEKQTEIVSQKEVVIEDLEETNAINDLNFRETVQTDMDEEAVGCTSKVDRTADNKDMSATSGISFTNAYEDKTSTLDASKIKSEERTPDQEVAVTESGLSRPETPDAPPPSVSSEMARKLDEKFPEFTCGSQISISAAGSGSKDKISFEQTRVKSTGKKKKKREILSKADAAGTTSDLYMAYKGPEEKQETAITSESIESSSTVDVKQPSVNDTEKAAIASEEDAQSKAELEDWEDAADISTPQLKTSENGEHRNNLDQNGSGDLCKKTYSRDFLMTFSGQCTDLPVGFEIGSDIASLLNVQVGTSYLVDREPYPSTGRVIDRPTGGPRLERRGSGTWDDDKWSKARNLTSGRDPRLDVGHGGAGVNFWPGQGGNHGVLKNPHGQSYGQYGGGILSGPMQSLAPPGGMPRNILDADKWQRATGVQRGLIPSPQTPLQAMHKAEKKYEVGKVSDEEQAKQRQLKGILNKLTPQNFEKLFEQVKAVNIDNADTLTGIISQIFDKALMEPTFCEMYANFCYHLAGELPDFSKDNEKITFKRLLLNKCQEEFERGEREQAEANRVEEEGETKRSKEEREEKKVQARRRMLGNIRLIGELYKKRMLTERIMHECIKKLLGQYESPDEEDVEALCKLMSTIGEMIDHPKAKEHMDFYFDMMFKLSNNQKLSSRVRFMLKDAIDLRKNKWQQRRKIEGPKKIEEVHRDAAQERQVQTSRLSRGPGPTSSARRGQPVDYGPRGSTMLSSPSTQQMGGFRGMPPQVRGFGTQDFRMEDRNSFDSRTPSVPLPQRPIDDDAITLGPQGGLARGMSIRGQPLMPSLPLPDVSSTDDSRRMMALGPNGNNSVSDWSHFNSREELMPRYIPDRFIATPTYDLSNSQERNTSFGNRDLRNADRSFDRSTVTSPPMGRVQGSSTRPQNVPSESVVSEDQLRALSIATIREFYSLRDEDEVRFFIKELNSPNFNPNMVTLWVTDSFDRKNDIDRDLLAKLLVNLCKSQNSLLSQLQLVKGFESVLAFLEDTVTDSPKAAEYLGRIFATVILENVVPFREIGCLIHEGGEEPGSLLQSGIASDVLVSILEIIRKEKGDSVLNEIRVNSNLQLEDFLPPDPVRSRKLDAFIM